MFSSPKALKLHRYANNNNDNIISIHAEMSAFLHSFVRLNSSYYCDVSNKAV